MITVPNLIYCVFSGVFFSANAVHVEPQRERRGFPVGLGSASWQRIRDQLNRPSSSLHQQQTHRKRGLVRVLKCREINFHYPLPDCIRISANFHPAVNLI